MEIKDKNLNNSEILLISAVLIKIVNFKNFKPILKV